MKACFAILLALFTSSISYTQNNQVVISNGKWNNNSTWGLGHSPTNGEIAIIPKDSILVVDNNMVISSDITLKVYGTLNFQVGKLRLTENSVVLVYPGGTITSTQGTPSDKIEIGGVSKYTGNEGTLTGPLMANAATSDFEFFPVVLPVRFIDYSISNFNNTVLLKWTTTEEENVESYLIERNAGAGNGWEVIGHIPPSDKPTPINQYNYQDKKRVSGLAYYRVRQVDKEGHSLYTSIKSIRLTSSITSLEVNVAGQNLIITIPEQLKGTVIVRLFKFSGEVAAQQNCFQPSRTVLFNKVYFKGLYIVSVSDGSTQKISRQIFFN